MPTNAELRSQQTSLLMQLKRAQEEPERLIELIHLTQVQMTQEDIAWVEKMFEAEKKQINTIRKKGDTI